MQCAIVRIRHRKSGKRSGNGTGTRHNYDGINCNNVCVFVRDEAAQSPPTWFDSRTCSNLLPVAHDRTRCIHGWRVSSIFLFDCECLISWIDLWHISTNTHTRIHNKSWFNQTWFLCQLQRALLRGGGYHLSIAHFHYHSFTTISQEWNCFGGFFPPSNPNYVCSMW